LDKGPEFPISEANFRQINDTHFAAPYSDASGIYFIGVFYIDSQLTIRLQSSFKYGSQTGLLLLYVPQSPIIQVKSGQTLLTLDINTLQPVSLQSFDVGPFTLGNGSLLIYDSAGYWIVDPKTKANSFISLPTQAYLYDYKTSDTLWAMYTAAKDNSMNKSCYLVQFTFSKSSIQKIPLTGCPCFRNDKYAKEGVFLDDVTIAGDGSYNVTYRCDAASLYISTNNNTSSKLVGVGYLAFSNSILFPDYPNSRLYIANEFTSIVLSTYSLTTGMLNKSQILATSQGPFAGFSKDILIYAYSKPSNQIIVYNLTLGAPVCQINTTVAISTSSSAQSIVPLGYNPNASCILSGFVLQANNGVYFVNSNGQYVSLDISGKDVNAIWGTGSNSFGVDFVLKGAIKTVKHFKINNFALDSEDSIIEV